MYRLLIILILGCIHCSCQVSDEKRLRDNLLRKYTWLVRPVANNSHRLEVTLKFHLKRIVELNLKDQILTINVKIDHEWTDYKLKWNPQRYGGITHIVMPSEKIWCPDTYLWNSFEYPDEQFKTAKTIIKHTGLVTWSPTLVLRSFCPINVRFYPFDIQSCQLTFGSWVYHGYQLFMSLTNLSEDNASIPVGMSLSEYHPSSEWELLSIPATLFCKYYVCCKEPYYLTIRRQTLVYRVNLIMPLLFISFLSGLVFYLPTDSGQKITLTVSVLMSQIMFLLLMMDNIPVTSLAVPLLGRLIIFNIALVVFSICATTVVLRVYFKKPTNSPPMADKLKSLCRNKFLHNVLLIGDIPKPVPMTSTLNESTLNVPTLTKNKLENLSRLALHEEEKEMKPEHVMQRALNTLVYLREHTARKVNIENECQEWKLMAAIIDRICLLLYNITFCVGNAWILTQAPGLFDNTSSLTATEVTELV